MPTPEEKKATAPERPAASHRWMRSAGSESSTGVKTALDTAWRLSAEARPGHPVITSASLLLALAAMARRDACPGSRTLAFLSSELAGRWDALDRERLRLARDEEVEAGGLAPGAGRWSRPAHRVMHLAQMLAEEGCLDGHLRLRHLLLAMLLQPSLPERPSCHWALLQAGLEPASLRRRFENAIPY